MPTNSTLRRYQLQSVLEGILGSENVYFQPPDDSRINYPCIIYTLATDHTLRANNKLYFRKKKYTVTVIDPDPDTNIPDRIAELNFCKMSSSFTTHNLNHYVFGLYF